MLEFLSPHQVVTCQRHNMYWCNFLDYERIIVRLYSNETVVNFICLNKEFVIVIVIVIALHDFSFYIKWNLLTSTSYKYSDSTIFYI